MKMMKLGWCIAAGFFLGCATASPPPSTTSQSTQSVQSTSSAPVATAKKKNKKEGLICESYKVTGSHIRKEICRTPEQAKREREQAEKLMRDADRARPSEGT